MLKVHAANHRRVYLIIYFWRSVFVNIATPIFYFLIFSCCTLSLILTKFVCNSITGPAVLSFTTLCNSQQSNGNTQTKLTRIEAALDIFAFARDLLRQEALRDFDQVANFALMPTLSFNFD